jgi:hypothetical protein
MEDTSSIKALVGILPQSFASLKAYIAGINDRMAVFSAILPVLQRSVVRIEETVDSTTPTLRSSVSKLAGEISSIES